MGDIMNNKERLFATACVIGVLFFATACFITILGYAGYISNSIKVENSMYVACPEYISGCSCNVVGDDRYMIDECLKFVERNG